VNPAGIIILDAISRVESGRGTSGERRLPACSSRQLAEMLLGRCKRIDPLMSCGVSGRLPETAGWQPALPSPYASATFGSRL